MLGKRLYSILFQNKGQLDRSVNWAVNHPHTGSRKDYWPKIFNDVNEGLPGVGFKRRLKECQLREGAHKLYSPRLEFVWENIEHP